MAIIPCRRLRYHLDIHILNELTCQNDPRSGSAIQKGEVGSDAVALHQMKYLKKHLALIL